MNNLFISITFTLIVYFIVSPYQNCRNDGNSSITCTRNTSW